MEIGFIGLGKMGRPMAERLLSGGHGVHVYNRSSDAMHQLERKGAIPAMSATEIARTSEAVLTALPTLEAVIAVFEELSAVATNGQVFVDHSTVSIGVTRHCAELVAARGADFLDAPVSGGPAGAAAGTLTVMVGGDAATYELMLPIFQCFGKNIRLCGNVGAGQAVKLVNQLLVGIHTAAIAEAAVLGVKLGADPATVLELIGTSFGGSTMMTRNLPRFIARDFSPATSVSLLVKDLGIIHDEARKNGVPVFLGGLVEQRFIEAQARGWGQQDIAAVVQLWEEAAGAEV